jgi:hypothetical protein
MPQAIRCGTPGWITRECQLWVKSGNAHNEPMMSAFHPKATEQRTSFMSASCRGGSGRCRHRRISRRIRAAIKLEGASKVLIMINDTGIIGVRNNASSTGSEK